jgi:hypothetical protein
MNTTSTRIDRRTYLATTGAVTAGVVGIAGCIGDATGTLATRVTDQPGDIGDFESCVVTIVGTWLGAEGAEDAETAEGTDEESDRTYHAYDEPRTADLVELQGENTQLVDERDLETGTHAFLQLDTDGIDATLEDGTAADVQVPGEAPLTFNERFEIREDTRTTFTADFTPVQRGQAGGYILQPVPTGITVEYDAAE